MKGSRCKVQESNVENTKYGRKAQMEGKRAARRMY
jgi:hypothetical protein